MERSEPTRDHRTRETTTSQAGFMAAGTGLFDWEQRILGGGKEVSRKMPEEPQVQIEAEAEAGPEAVEEGDALVEVEEPGSEALPGTRAFWSRLK